MIFKINGVIFWRILLKKFLTGEQIGVLAKLGNYPENSGPKIEKSMFQKSSTQTTESTNSAIVNIV
jgi:hypothetical protein